MCKCIRVCALVFNEAYWDDVWIITLNNRLRAKTIKNSTNTLTEVIMKNNVYLKTCLTDWRYLTVNISLYNKLQLDLHYIVHTTLDTHIFISLFEFDLM